MKNHIRLSRFVLPLSLALLFPFTLSAQKQSVDTSKHTTGLRPELETEKPRKRPSKKAQNASAVFRSSNYFYGSMKFPTADLANAISQEANEDSEYENKNGLIFDIGYGMPITRYFSLEAGLEALIANPFQATVDKPEVQGYGALDIKNRSFALQLRPVFNHVFDETVSVRVGTAINYRQLNSSGKYSIIQERNETEEVLSSSHHAYRSRFYLQVEPFAGVDFTVTEKFAFGVDLTYVRIKWNRSLDDLRFSNEPDLIMPNHRTSMVFLSLRAVFR